MLKILLGRSLSGKSHAILTHIQEEGRLRDQLLLVPEQASHETERRLCEHNGNTSSLYAEVFSFTSLAHRIQTLSGGRARPVLDDGGRLLVMYKALNATESSLRLFGPLAQKPEFLTQLIATVDDLKSCCVTPAKLREIADLSEGLSAKRLQDLALIYGAYDALTASGASDPRDNLSLLAQALDDRSFVAGKDCYLDGFTDFTPQEEQVILRLLLHGASVTVALTCDHFEDTNDVAGVFSSGRHTAHLLMRMAQQNHIPVEIITLPPREDARPADLSHLERELFAESPTGFLDAPTSLQLCKATNRREEVTWVAGQIRNILYTEGGHCRDIAVAARSIDPYSELIYSIFAQHEIPVFQSSMEVILQKPVFGLIIAALDVMTGNFAYEDIFRYLKSGLADISPEDCDLLENYALTWRLHTKDWVGDEGFRHNPQGYGSQMDESDQEHLAFLNILRCKVVLPFLNFIENSADTAESKVISLYSFMEDIHLPDQLDARSKALLDQGQPELASEYQQLWDILCNALEQCIDTLGQQSLSLDAFSRLLKLLLSQYTVGSIPASLDRVTAGDLPRLSNRRIKTLFILGADDGSIPQIPPRNGLFGEEELALLSDYGITLTPAIDAQMKRELTILYVACAQAQERLLISWPSLGEGGNETSPSLLVQQTFTIFPKLHPIVAASASEQNPAVLQLLAFDSPELHRDVMIHYQDLASRLGAASTWKRGNLSQASVKHLYGNTFALSPSRLDRYKSCQFSYFLKYGLKATPRKAAGFYAPEYGTFIHFVLEEVLRQGKELGPIAGLTLETIGDLTRAAIDRYTTEHLGGLERQTPRFRYLFLRLERSVTMVVQNVIEELRSSDFQPLCFELGFGTGKELPPVLLQEGDLTLSISGFVDRVDGWVRDGRLYLKVVDYKTGRKSFDFTDLWHGLGLQMLLYLFALEDHAEFFGVEQLVPAGVLYLPTRDVMVAGSRNMPDEVRKRMVEKELTRKGLILDDPAVLEALECPTESGPRFLPIRVSSKTQAITGDALVSAEQLGRLKQHIQSILKGICGELNRGSIVADPFWRSEQQNACLYCDYASACHFDERLGEDRRRYTHGMRKQEFWARLDAQEGGLDE